MDNRGNRRVPRSRTEVYGFSDSEYIDAAQLRARQKKPVRTQYNAEQEASQYGFSKNVTKRNGKNGRKAKKVNHVKLRVVFGILAALIGALVGVSIFGFWYKEYLLNIIVPLIALKLPLLLLLEKDIDNCCFHHYIIMDNHNLRSIY